MKEKYYKNCFKCKLNLENNTIFKCKQCDKIYCSNCFLFDMHIKNNLNYLNIDSKKCKKHQCELNNYCIDCGKRICIFCLNSDFDNNPHKKHSIKYILECMPTNNQINNLNDKIKIKSKKIEELIISIDKWKENLLERIERLKNCLKSEIYLLEKMFINYNQYFVNYIYFINFEEIEKYIGNINNKYLNNFNINSPFEEQTKNIMKILCYGKKEIEQKKGVLIEKYKMEEGMVAQINEDIFLNHYFKSKLLDLDYYNKKDDSIYYLNNSEVTFKEKIYSVSYSNKNNKIYICLENDKIVKIFDFNIKDKELIMCKEEIKVETKKNGHFNKCIYLNNDLLATSDNNEISLWNYISPDYINTKVIKIERSNFDIILVDDNYFAYTQSYEKKIIFQGINNIESKIINDIDCINKDYNCLFLIKDYLIVNCHNGIALISIKTYEYVQYIKSLKGYENEKKLCIGGNNDIYVLSNSNNKLSLIKMDFINNCFVITEEYQAIEKEDNDNNDNESESRSSSEDEDNLNRMEIIYNKGFVFLWDKNFYILKEKNFS